MGLYKILSSYTLLKNYKPGVVIKKNAARLLALNVLFPANYKSLLFGTLKTESPWAEAKGELCRIYHVSTPLNMTITGLQISSVRNIILHALSRPFLSAAETRTAETRFCKALRLGRYKRHSHAIPVTLR